MFHHVSWARSHVCFVLSPLDVLRLIRRIYGPGQAEGEVTMVLKMHKHLLSEGRLGSILCKIKQHTKSDQIKWFNFPRRPFFSEGIVTR